MQRPSLEGRSILIVEDEPLITLDITQEFEGTGAALTTTNTLHHALILVEHDGLSGAILDHSLGDGDSSLLYERAQRARHPVLDLQRIPRRRRGVRRRSAHQQARSPGRTRSGDGKTYPRIVSCCQCTWNVRRCPQFGLGYLDVFGGRRWGTATAISDAVRLRLRFGSMQSVQLLRGFPSHKACGRTGL